MSRYSPRERLTNSSSTSTVANWFGNQFVLVGFYDSIQTVTVGAGGSNSITFSSIPSTFTHLQIRLLGRDSRANIFTNFNIQFNSDTASNYAEHYLYGSSSAVAASAATSQTSSFIARIAGNSAASNVFGAGVIDILDYANTNKYKTIRSLSGIDDNTNTSGAIWFSSGLWQSTSAITSITINPITTPILQYSSFALYGIRSL